MILVIQINPMSYTQKIVLSNGQNILCSIADLEQTIFQLAQEQHISHIQIAGPEDYTAKVARNVRADLNTKFNHIEILYQKRGNQWENI